MSPSPDGDMVTPKQSTARRAVLALAATAVFFLVVEGALRVAGFSYPETDPPLVIWTGQKAWEFDKHDSLHLRHPDMLWAPKPGVELPWSPGETVNADGYRGPALATARKNDVVRIATLGDSSTFGLGVVWEETWTAQLGAELATRGIGNEVLCAGVIAYSARQGLERYRALVRDYRPDLVIAAFGALNEHWSALGDSDDVRIRKSQQANTPLQRALRAMRNGARTLHAVGYLVDWRSGRLDDGERSREAAAQANEEATEAGRVDWPGTRRVTPSELTAILEVLDEEVRAIGGSLMLIHMPRRPRAERVFPVLVEYTEAVRELAARAELPAYDARAAFRAHGDDDELFLQHDAVHPSPFGHQLLAQGLAPLVEKALRARGRAEQ